MAVGKGSKRGSPMNERVAEQGRTDTRTPESTRGGNAAGDGDVRAGFRSSREGSEAWESSSQPGGSQIGAPGTSHSNRDAERTDCDEGKQVHFATAVRQTAIRINRRVNGLEAPHSGEQDAGSSYRNGVCVTDGEDDKSKNSRKATSANGEKFAIESIVYGDGSSLGNLVLEDESWYASGTSDGGIESFHEIDPDTIVLSTRGCNKGGNWRSRPLTQLARGVTVTDTPRVNIPANKRNNRAFKQRKLRILALAWCMENKGFALTVGGPGARGVISNVSAYQITSFGSVYAQKAEGNCMESALVNAVDIVFGREIAQKVQDHFKEELPHITHLKEIMELLHKLRISGRLQKIKHDSNYLQNPFKVIAEFTSGIYLVHLKETGIVDYVVAVDANRRIILDSQEKYPMSLNENVLRLCGGDSASNLTVHCVRRLVDPRNT